MYGYVPIANYGEVGAVKPDGATIDVAPDGTISVDASVTGAPPLLELTDGINDVGRVSKITVTNMVVGGTSSAATLAPVLATEVNPGIMEPDGASLYVDQDGIESALLATTTTPGIVQPDDQTIVVSPSGVIHAATATTSQAGVVIPDGTTVHVTGGGVISAVNQGVSVTDGTTTVHGVTTMHAALAVVSGSAPNAIITPQTATTGQLGVVQPDGSTIDVAGGVISAAIASGATLGIVQPDNTTITIDSGGVISVPDATNSQIGVARPDGSTIVASAPGVLTVPLATTSTPGEVIADGSTIHVSGGGVISAAPGGVTATDGATSVAGATQITFIDAIVSGSTPNATVTPKQASTSQFGVVKPDGTSIVAAGGVLSATATGLPAGSQGDLLKHGASVWGSLAVGSAGQVPTSTGTDVGYAPQRVAMAAFGSVAGTRHEVDLANASGDLAITAADDPGGDAVHYDIDLAGSIKAAIALTQSSQAVVSSTAALCKSLWNGTTNVDPDTTYPGWTTVGFTPASWAAAVAAFTATTILPTGSTPIWDTFNANGSIAESVIFRQTFNLPSQVFISATLSVAADGDQDVYINGSHIVNNDRSSSQGPVVTVSVDTTILRAGLNVIANKNHDTGGGSMDQAWVAYRLDISYGTPTGIAGLTVEDDGTVVGTEPDLNFIAGANVTLDIVDDPADNRVNVTIASTGGSGSGAGQSGSVSITIAAGAATNTAAVTFSPAFGATPIVVVASSDGTLIASSESISASGFTARLTASTPLAPGASVTATLSWTAGGGEAAGVVTLARLGGLPAASADFTSIPAGYSSLELEWSIRTTSGNAEDVLWLRINGDSGAHYAWVEIFGTTSAAGSQGATGDSHARVGVVAGGTATTGRYSSGILRIPNYAAGSFVAGQGGSSRPTQPFAATSMFEWAQAAAVTEVTLTPASGNIAVGSLVVLRGIV